MAMTAACRNSAGEALFEVTISFNPGVLARYFLRADGFWHQGGLCLLSICWLVFGTTLQLALAAYFPEFPLYPLPLAVSYLSWRRPPLWGMFCAIFGGILLDSLLFADLGTGSCLLGVVSLWSFWLRQRVGSKAHLGVYGMVLGGGSVFLYVLLKLVILGFSTGGDAVVSVLFRQLVVGTLLGGVCMAPLTYWLLEGVEWLLRLHVSKEGEAHANG